MSNTRWSGSPHGTQREEEYTGRYNSESPDGWLPTGRYRVGPDAEGTSQANPAPQPPPVIQPWSGGMQPGAPYPSHQSGLPSYRVPSRSGHGVEGDPVVGYLLVFGLGLILVLWYVLSYWIAQGVAWLLGIQAVALDGDTLGRLYICSCIGLLVLSYAVVILLDEDSGQPPAWRRAIGHVCGILVLILVTIGVPVIMACFRLRWGG